jgi:Bifunctional DNA primase/polymerase, N-terminal/Primase C terminal 1 (PriCT-1)
MNGEPQSVLQAAPARGTFASWQPVYAEHGIPTFPVGEDKRPAVRGYPRVGLRGSRELASKFAHARAFGFMCGARSNVTVLDVDTTDEKVLADALSTYGSTPVISRTASGGFHALYRHNGEQRRIRPVPNVPIDILGGGYAVAPPSRVARGTYEFIQGGLDDLGSLKPMAAAPAPDQATSTGPLKAATSRLRGMREHDGRNNALFLAIGPIARKIDQASGSREQILEIARAHNAQCAEPMEDKEVTRIVDSVWGMTLEGRNVIGLRGAFCLTVDHLAIADSDAFKLLAFLRAHQGPHAHFMCANGGLTETFGWSRKRLAHARHNLIELGYLVPIRQAGRGNPALFRWGSY